MPTISGSQFAPPKNWEEFEEICADVFMLEWNDRNTVRHGRQGQRQYGVDIYGNPIDGGNAGVQCKGKRVWPPTALTTSDIDAEITEALKFKPSLTEFIFATTAPDDVNIQAHARKITERHNKRGLFSVHVLGWGELVRRLTKYQSLIEKHFEYLTHNALREEIASIPQKTADILSETLGSLPVGLVDNEIERRMEALRKKRFFIGSSSEREAKLLYKLIKSGELKSGSRYIKSRALSLCARILSNIDVNTSTEILEQASQLAQCEDIDIAKAFLRSANGKYCDALKELMAVHSPPSVSAALMIISNKQSTEKAFEWFEKTQLSFNDLDSDGKFFFLSRCIEIGKWSHLYELSNTLVEEDYNQTPALFSMTAIANLAQAIPTELRRRIIGPVPFDARDFPMASDQQALVFIRNARNFFEKCALAAQSLDLKEAAAISSDFVLWLGLRDPEQHDTAKKDLNESMRDPVCALRRLNFALQFGLKIDIEAVNREIDRSNALSGGTSSDAAFARFVLAFTQKSPEGVIEYINRYRDEISRYVASITIGTIEIEMLARAGRLEDAVKCLEELQCSGLDKETEEKLNRFILEAKGKDRVKSSIEAYQNDESIDNLASLVDSLEKSEDWERLSQYALLLFDRTHSLIDAKRLARALNETGQHSKVAEFLRKYPEFLDQSDILRSLWCWILYREGAIEDCAKCLRILLEKRDDPNDRSLEVGLAILSGNWENLSSFVEKEWNKKDSRTPHELLQVAQLANSLGLQRTKDLVQTAIQSAKKDPDIFLNAYIIAVSGGWENAHEAIDWLPKAIKYSGENGPIQRMPIKDIFNLKPDWDRKENDVWSKLKKGELPYFSVAKLLNRSLIDLFLLPALTNPKERDPRQRANIYAFSGLRQPTSFEAKTIILDVTSLLTLSMLRIFDQIVNSFENIIIPHQTLGWLFEEKEKIRFHQPSKIKNAKQLRQLLDDKYLFPFESTANVDLDLAAEVGEELAALIAEADIESGEDESQRLVIKTYPVHKVGSLMEEEVDLSLYQTLLCSCTAVIEKLKQKGQLTFSEEKMARAYLSVNEQRWPSEPIIQDNAIIYLDDLSVNYLQHLKLLHKLHAAGLKAYVSAAETNETKALIKYENLTSEAIDIIEKLRVTLARGISAGKIKLGPLPMHLDEQHSDIRLHPTVNIFDIAGTADAVVIDDRSLNRHRNIDTGSNIVPVLTTLDILDSLYSSGKLDFEAFQEHRTALRRSGYLFVYLNDNELNYHLKAVSLTNGNLNETAELKAIRENILQARMTGAVVLPNEAAWVHKMMQVMGRNLQSQWVDQTGNAVSEACSNWLLQFLDLRGWSSSLGQEAGVRMASHGLEITIMTFLFPPEGLTKETKRKYWQWVEDAVIKPIKQESPDVFKGIIKYVKELISNIEDSHFMEGTK